MYQNSRYFIVFVWTLAVAVASPFLVVSTIFEFRVSLYLYQFFVVYVFVCVCVFFVFACLCPRVFQNMSDFKKKYLSKFPFLNEQ